MGRGHKGFGKLERQTIACSDGRNGMSDCFDRGGLELYDHSKCRILIETKAGTAGWIATP